jgi:hypothetical protein
MTVLEQFKYFLGSRKVAETVSPELRMHISVQTGLEGPLLSALSAERDVVIAGSAGGGKSHLLDSVFGGAEPVTLPVRWPDEPEPTGRFIRVISDATALAVTDRHRMMSPRPKNCVAVAIAINEGPLLALKRAHPISSYARAVELLHSGQQGVRLPPDLDAPVVIDVGGYDPVEAGVIARLANLPLLSELVETSPCTCEDPRICPRRLSWRLLRSEGVRRRLNDVMRVVGMSGRAILFRELWDFVADLALGGTCSHEEAAPPTSPWFWRAFYGASDLSARLRSTTDPSQVVFPRAEAHIWYGDWTSDAIALLPDLQFVPLPSSGRYSAEEYRWLKAQLFFTAQSASVLDIIREQVDFTLATALHAGRTGDLVAALNRYMSYGTTVPSQQVLQLWMDLSVERRWIEPMGRFLLEMLRLPTSPYVSLVRSSTIRTQVAKCRALARSLSMIRVELVFL